jgi:hypothetical protein
MNASTADLRHSTEVICLVGTAHLLSHFLHMKAPWETQPVSLLRQWLNDAMRFDPSTRQIRL